MTREAFDIFRKNLGDNYLYGPLMTTVSDQTITAEKARELVAYELSIGWMPNKGYDTSSRAYQDHLKECSPLEAA